MLRAWAEQGLITWLPTEFAPGVNPQFKEYQHALLLLDELRDYKWALFVDDDEFLNFRPSQPGALRQFIDNVKSVYKDELPAGVAFPWNWRLSNKAFARESVFVLEEYPYAAPNEHLKSLIRVGEVASMCKVHVPVFSTQGFLVDGQLRKLVA